MKSRISLKKMLDIFLFILLTMFMLYITFDFFNISKTLKELQREKIELTFKNEKETLITLLKLDFLEELNNEIKKIMLHSKEIKNVVINIGKKRYSYSSVNTGRKIVIPVVEKNKKVGEIIVFYDEKSFLEHFFEKYFIRFLIYVGIVLPLIALVFFYFKKRITKLNFLAKKLEKINFKKISYIKPVDNYYEIVNITNAVNKLLSQVNLFYENQRKFLQRIIKYKKHLETAQQISEMFSWDYDCKSKQFTLNKRHIKFLGLKQVSSFEDFLNHMDEKDKNRFLKYIKEACENCSSFEFVHKFINDNAKIFYLKTVGKCIKDKIIGVSLNVTEDILKQQKIEFLAYHDPLTSLPNRTYLKEQFNLLLSIAKRDGKKIGVLYLDLDNFKMVNDTLGHESGDKLLIEIASRLQKALRKSDVIVRIGGDEFVVILNGINSKKDVLEVVNKITNVLKEPIIIKTTPIYPTFSIGCAIFPDDSEDEEELLKFADIAMYEAKNKGKNNCAFINEELKKQVDEYYNITSELKKALKKDNELVLFFQPKIDIKNKKIEGAEGLIRWYHPTRGLLSPFYFIPHAEKSNLIVQIDRYVMKKAFETLKKWQKGAFKDYVLAINISANEFRQRDFVSNLKNLLNEYKIDPAKLEIEITETLSMQNISYAISVLEEVKALGFKIALDDFGTGYSSLNYLKKLPFDTLKIDQTFIRDLETDNDDLVITKLIIQIANVLNKKTVAEGVETKKLLEIVEDLGCDIAQGYYFSPPLEEKKFIEYCKNFKYPK